MLQFTIPEWQEIQLSDLTLHDECPRGTFREAAISSIAHQWRFNTSTIVNITIPLSVSQGIIPVFFFFSSLLQTTRWQRVVWHQVKKSFARDEDSMVPNTSRARYRVSSRYPVLQSKWAREDQTTGRWRGRLS